MVQSCIHPPLVRAVRNVEKLQTMQSTTPTTLLPGKNLPATLPMERWILVAFTASQQELRIVVQLGPLIKNTRLLFCLVLSTRAGLVVNHLGTLNKKQRLQFLNLKLNILVTG